jgi:hypothetical protein
MKTFFCVVKATGRMAGTWTGASAPPPDNDRHVFIDAETLPNFEPGDTVDLATLVVTKRPATARIKRLSRFEFMSLMTRQERAALRTAAVTDAVLGDAFNLLEMATHMEPEHAFVTQMLGYIVQIGVMTAARRDEFLVAVLAKSTG